MSKLISKQTLPDGEKAPQIEFPCQYPIKVLGTASVEFTVTVVQIVKQYDPDFDETTVTKRDSAKGTFCSVTLTINATGKDQLDALHKALKATGVVKMVL